ncbi:hypothetical protein CRG98_010575 [Punica granatum]|nr:hypothetical protein CRG98_010575 [Punica granatum]
MGRILKSEVSLIENWFVFSCSAGLGAAEEPPPASTQIDKPYQENKISISSSALVTQRDSVPIINPTTPTTTPIVNPSSSPPPVPSSPTFANPSPTFANPSPTFATPSPTFATPTSPAAATTPTTSSGGAWCIASPSASETALQVALDYACGYGGADCSAIQSGGSCYDPNNVRDHASYAFNDYYQKNPAPTSCDFGGTAQLSHTDPSHGSCRFASSKTSSPATPTPVTPTPVTTTPSVPSPPSPTFMTPTTTEPGVPFGVAEPTGLPSSTNHATCSLLVLLITTGLILAADYL